MYLQGFQLSRIERESPVWTLLLPLSRQACKTSRINEKNPAKHVKSHVSVGKTLKIIILQIFVGKEACNPRNHNTYQFRFKRDVKLSIL